MLLKPVDITADLLILAPGLAGAQAAELLVFISTVPVHSLMTALVFCAKACCVKIKAAVKIRNSVKWILFIIHSIIRMTK
jgi:hypothetical protein